MSDPLQPYRNAYPRALDALVEQTRTARSRIEEPLSHEGRANKADRKAYFRELFSNPLALQAKVAEAQGRWNLPPDKPFPRRLVRALIEGQKLLEEED